MDLLSKDTSILGFTNANASNFYRHHVNHIIGNLSPKFPQALQYLSTNYGHTSNVNINKYKATITHA